MYLEQIQADLRGLYTVITKQDDGTYKATADTPQGTLEGVGNTESDAMDALQNAINDRFLAPIDLVMPLR